MSQAALNSEPTASVYVAGPFNSLDSDSHFGHLIYHFLRGQPAFTVYEKL